MTPMHGPDGASPGGAKREELRETGNLAERVWELERRVERQAAAIQALFALLAKAGATPAAFVAEMREVEAQRGLVAQKACVKCGHTLGRRQMTCVYCGAPRLVESPFELL